MTKSPTSLSYTPAAAAAAEAAPKTTAAPTLQQQQQQGMQQQQHLPLLAWCLALGSPAGWLLPPTAMTSGCLTWLMPAVWGAAWATGTSCCAWTPCAQQQVGGLRPGVYSTLCAVDSAKMGA